MKTLITGLQKVVDAGDLRGHARCASIRGGHDSFSTLPFTITPYHGKYDPAAYIDWELELEQKFSYHDIPAVSQVQTDKGSPKESLSSVMKILSSFMGWLLSGTERM
jgi:hypothetical protein